MPKRVFSMKYSLVLLGKWYNLNLNFKISLGEHAFRPSRGGLKICPARIFLRKNVYHSTFLKITYDGNTFVKSGSLVKNDQNQQTWLKIKTSAIFE